MNTISDFTATRLDGQDQPLADYAGQVVLVVNTASKCGLTPQFEGLERLWQTYREQGVVVLGFPCNQFAHQEPGDSEQIQEFCSRNYGVSFPMFARVDVNGAHAHPLFAWLKASRSGTLTSAIKWNFTKFLIGRDGQVLARYAPKTKPDELVKVIESALTAS